MMTARRTSFFVLALAGLWATTACTSKPDIPKATGPSELGLSLNVLAPPDVLTPDGLSTSQITVTARGQFLLRNIAQCFDAHAASPDIRYSRAV